MAFEESGKKHSTDRISTKSPAHLQASARASLYSVRNIKRAEGAMNDRKLVSGRWAASWTNITSSVSNQVTSYAFATTLGIFALNDDGTVTGEFRMKDGAVFNVRTFTGNFDVSWDAAHEVLSGTVTITVDATGNVNTTNFVRVNSDELIFILEKATKADGTPRTLMVHGNLHRIRPQ